MLSDTLLVQFSTGSKTAMGGSTDFYCTPQLTGEL